MIRWYICLQNKGSVKLGTLDSYLEKHLPEDICIIVEPMFVWSRFPCGTRQMK